MRVDIIRQPLSLTAILVALLLALFWSRNGIWPMDAELIPSPAGPIGTWFDIRLAPFDGLRIGLSCVLLFLNAFQITRIVIRNMVLVVRTYQPALFFIIVGCGFFLPVASLSVVAAAFLIIHGSGLMIAGFQREHTYDRFFRAGFALGFAPLFHAPAIIALPMLIGGLAFFRRGWRESIIAIVAFLLPTALYTYIGWWAGLPADLPFWQLVDALTRPSGFCLWADAGIPRLIAIGLLSALTILSIGTSLLFTKKTRTRARRVYAYFVWVLLLTIGCFFLPSTSSADWMILAVPMAVVAPNFFVRYAGTIPSLIYLLLLAGVVAINLIPFFAT